MRRLKKKLKPWTYVDAEYFIDEVMPIIIELHELDRPQVVGEVRDKGESWYGLDIEMDKPDNIELFDSDLMHIMPDAKGVFHFNNIGYSLYIPIDVEKPYMFDRVIDFKFKEKKDEG